jgi:hypothetical protein
MSTFESGAAVKSGYYLNAKRWHVEPIANDGDKLPAAEGSWVRVNTVVALALVPVLGATFLMSLPVIGFAVFGRAIVGKALAVFSRGAGELASTVSPGWAAGEAHLGGKPGEEKAAEPKASKELDALGEEIAARKGEKK